MRGCRESLREDRRLKVRHRSSPYITGSAAPRPCPRCAGAGPALWLWTESPCALQRSAALPSTGKTLPGSPGANCRGHSSGPTGTPALLEARRGRTPRVAPACGSPALPGLRKDTKLGAARLGQEPSAGGGCGCCVRHRPLLQVRTNKDLPEGDD